MNLNLNTEQVGIFDGDGKKRPITLGLAYNTTITAGQSQSWSYTAPPNARVVITDLIGKYTGGDLAVAVKDGSNDQYFTSLSINATNVMFDSVFRPAGTPNSTALLQYPIELQPNGQIIITVTNTHATTSATAVYAAAMGVLCLS